jgi:hypothetical protein
MSTSVMIIEDRNKMKDILVPASITQHHNKHFNNTIINIIIIILLILILDLFFNNYYLFNLIWVNFYKEFKL